MRRIGGACLAVVALALCGAAGARADTNAQCALSAHVAFSNPVTMSQSLGHLSSDAAGWSCQGTLDGMYVASSQNFLAWGLYGDSAGPFLGQANPDTCAVGVEELTLTNIGRAPTMPSDVALNIVLHRTGVLLSADGEGSIGHDGLVVSGTGTFMPDSGASCLTSGWSSGWIRLSLSVQAGPYPGDLLGRPVTSTARHRTRHLNRHKHKHHRRRHH
jgi:hypothetical protein